MTDIRVLWAVDKFRDTRMDAYAEQGLQVCKYAFELLTYMPTPMKSGLS